MSNKIRFEHGYIPEIKRFKITSPDIKGFFITGDTYEETEREALAMVALIRHRSGKSESGKLESVQFAEA